MTQKILRILMDFHGNKRIFAYCVRDFFGVKCPSTFFGGVRGCENQTPHHNDGPGCYEFIIN